VISAGGGGGWWQSGAPPLGWGSLLCSLCTRPPIALDVTAEAAATLCAATSAELDAV
jgi:hypothetical protein